MSEKYLLSDYFVALVGVSETLIPNTLAEISWTVISQETTQVTPNWWDGVYLSDNEKLDLGDVCLTQAYVGQSLDKENDLNYTLKRNIYFPNYLAFGNYYLIVAADVLGVQGEANRTNNIKAAPVTLSAPDLVVSDAKSSPNAILGHWMNVNWTVTNQGPMAAQGDWWDAVYLSIDEKFDYWDTFLSNAYVESQTPLAAAQSYQIERNLYFSADLAAGNYYLLFVADRNNTETESNNSNNTKAVPILLKQPEVDLAVPIATAPEFITPNSLINLSWVVTNQGDISTYGDRYDSIYLSDNLTWDASDTYLSSVLIHRQTAIDPNTGYSYSLPIWFSANQREGNQYLLFITNFYPGETNLSNNIKAVPITIALPDLIVTNVIAPTTAKLGASLELGWTVTNQGNVITTASNWSDRIYLSSDEIYDTSDIFLTDQWISSPTLPLTAGGNYSQNLSLTVPISAGTGNKYLLFVTDATWSYYEGYFGGNSQPETNENNNIKAVPITISAPDVDLVVTTATAPNSAVLGESINLSWTVSNQGTDKTSPQYAYWNDYVYLSSDATYDASDTYLTSAYIYSQLAGGSSYSQNLTATVPVSAGTGNKYLLFVTDGIRSYYGGYSDGNYQPETNENNNIKAVPITLSTPDVDLVVTTATAPATAVLGEGINLSWTVSNQGTDKTSPQNGYWDDYVYLSSDATYDASDTYLTSAYINSQLTGGSSYSQNLTATVPTSAGTGNKYLLFVTDATWGGSYYQGGNYQAETNENNNIKAVPITLSNPNVDLVVTATTTPATAVLGESINLSWTVSNQGTDKANQYWNDYVYLSSDATYDASDTYLTSAYISSQLAGGSSYSQNLTATVPTWAETGDKYLLFFTDATWSYYWGYSGGNYQPETNENNNIKAVPITLNVPNVDLVVTTATAPATVNLGESLNLSWTVNNQGTDSTTNAQYYYYYSYWSDQVYVSNDDTYDDSDTYLTSAYISSPTLPLEAGEGYTRSQTINIPTWLGFGNKYLLFRTDIGDNQLETNNNNNLKGIPIQIKAADLMVSATTVPEKVVLNRTQATTVDISWTVTNEGNLAIQGNWWDSVFLSTDESYDANDIYLAAVATNLPTSLTPGQSYNVSQTVTLPSSVAAGNYHLLFNTDAWNTQVEGDEVNNLKAVSIALASPEVNLVMSEVTAPSIVTLGSTANLSWTVINQGTGNTNTDWWDGIYLSSDQTFDYSDTFVGAAFIEKQELLNVGESYSLTQDTYIPSSLALGDYYLLFVADYHNYQKETEETDNVKSLAITLAVADLAITKAVAPVEAIIGNPIDVSWTVTNQSRGLTNADWWDCLYLSKDETFDSSDIYLNGAYRSAQGFLSIDDTYNMTQSIDLPTSLTAGDYYLLLAVDKDNYQRETREDNNIKALPITLNKPTSVNLYGQNISFMPDQISPAIMPELVPLF